MSFRVARQSSLLCLLACTLGVLVFAPALAATYERTVSLESYAPRLQEEPTGWLLLWDGASGRGVPGEPELPWMAFRVAVPADETILTVELVPLDEREIGTGIHLRPVPHFAENGHLIRAVPDPDAYGSTEWFPQERVQIGQTGFHEGYRILGIQICPARYLGAEGRLMLADEFMLRVHTGPAQSAVGVIRRVRPDAERDAAAQAKLGRRVDWILEEVQPLPKPVTSEPTGDAGFNPTPLPSLDGSAVDFVIISPAAFVDSFQVLADWKTRFGLRTQVVNIDDIVANYEAPDLAARMRTFLQHAYMYWGAEYALIGGDTDLLPVAFGHSTFLHPGDGVLLATDYYYACLDGDWNADGDHIIGELGDDVDLEPEIYVGRLPAGSRAEAGLMARKVIRYSGGEPERFERNYQMSPSFWAEALFWDREHDNDPWSGDCLELNFDGASIADSLYSLLPEDMQLGTEMIYETYECWTGEPYFPVPQDRQTCINDFNSGRHIVTHIGHGFRNLLAVGAPNDRIYNADADVMTNGDELSILYAINCTSGAVHYDCVVEHFLRNDYVNGSGGAVAAIAGTDEEYPSQGKHMTYLFFHELFENGRTRIGETFHETNRQWAPHATSDNADRWHMYSVILLSDPSLDVWTNLPADLAVEFYAPHADLQYEMGSGAITLRVNKLGLSDPVVGAQVTLFKEGEVFVTGTTDADGEVTLEGVNPVTVGDLHVSVLAHNYTPYPEVLDVTVSTAAHLHVADFAIDDSAGNSDAAADRGEQVEVSLTIGNVGGSDAETVTLEATTLSPYVDVINGMANVPDVPWGGDTVAEAITLDLLLTIPNSLSYVEATIDVAFEIGGGDAGGDSFVLQVGNPRIDHIGLAAMEDPGDGDGTIEPGESGKLVVTGFNAGDGTPVNAEVLLEAVDAVVTVTDPLGAIALAPAVPSVSDTLRFDVNSAGEIRFDLTYQDDNGAFFTRRIDLGVPTPPALVWSESGVDHIRVNWEPVVEPGVFGYNLYSATVERSEFEKVNTAPVTGGYFAQLGLPALTTFQFAVTTVDSSGNESAHSDTISEATSPPLTDGWPVDVQGGENRGSITYANLDGAGIQELVFGSSYLYAVTGDGVDYYDGDAAPATVGIFSELGYSQTARRGFVAKPAVGDIDLDGHLEIVACHFEQGRIYVWDEYGNFEWGGETHDVGDLLWSSPALGNIDWDPELEIILWSGSPPGNDYGGTILAFNHDGTEVTNGDNDTGTYGVLWDSPEQTSGWNYSSIALWDFDGDSLDEIIAVERFEGDGLVHMLDYEPGVGVVEPNGWPFDPPNEGHQFSASPAIVDLNGTEEDNSDDHIFVISRKSLIGINADGTMLAGYPEFYGDADLDDFNDFQPSPVIGDINGDGDLDVVHGWAGGMVYAYTALTGAPLPNWPVQLDIVGDDSEEALYNASLANLDADDESEVLVGSGGGKLFAIDGDGSVLPGFPYGYGGALFGAPAVSDFDGNGSVDIAIIGETTKAFCIEMMGVPVPAGENEWPMFRHDVRNTGVYNSPVAVPINLGSLVMRSTAPGRVELSWMANGEYQQFDIERASAGELRHKVGEIDGASQDRYTFVDETAPYGEMASYWILGYTAHEVETIGPFDVQVMARVIAQTALHQNRPNPFNPTTEIRYDVAGELGGVGAVDVRLEIFDIGGRRVAELVNAPQEAGEHRLIWDGRDDTGHVLSSGIYLYRLSVGEDVLTRKLVLAR